MGKSMIRQEVRLVLGENLPNYRTLKGENNKGALGMVQVPSSCFMTGLENQGLRAVFILASLILRFGGLAQ